MSSKDYRIEPPPKDRGSEPLFRIVYVIDVNAPSVLEAAKLTYQIMTDPESLLPVLDVIDGCGKVVNIDLSKDN
jgi:hypothetical protein